MVAPYPLPRLHAKAVYTRSRHDSPEVRGALEILRTSRSGQTASSRRGGCGRRGPAVILISLLGVVLCTCDIGGSDGSFRARLCGVKFMLLVQLPYMSQGVRVFRKREGIPGVCFHSRGRGVVYQTHFSFLNLLQFAAPERRPSGI